MGEYADYMLNGDDCAGCGMPFMDGSSGQGFPRYCCRACEPAGYRRASINASGWGLSPSGDSGMPVRAPARSTALTA